MAGLTPPDYPVIGVMRESASDLSSIEEISGKYKIVNTIKDVINNVYYGICRTEYFDTWISKYDPSDNTQDITWSAVSNIYMLFYSLALSADGSNLYSVGIDSWYSVGSFIHVFDTSNLPEEGFGEDKYFAFTVDGQSGEPCSKLILGNDGRLRFLASNFNTSDTYLVSINPTTEDIISVNLESYLTYSYADSYTMHITTDRDNNIYVFQQADTYDGTSYVLKITPDLTVTTFYSGSVHFVMGNINDANNLTCVVKRVDGGAFSGYSLATLNLSTAAVVDINADDIGLTGGNPSNIHLDDSGSIYISGTWESDGTDYGIIHKYSSTGVYINETDDGYGGIEHDCLGWLHSRITNG